MVVAMRNILKVLGMNLVQFLLLGNGLNVLSNGGVDVSMGVGVQMNPLEGKEVKMAKGMVYEPHCKCGAYGFGIHIVQENEPFDNDIVEGCCCISCGSSDVEWLPAGFSKGDQVVMKKGWRAK